MLMYVWPPRSLLRSRADAEAIQLTVEYALEPPFDAGRPDTAPAAITQRITAARAGVVERARIAAKLAGARLGRVSWEKQAGELGRP